MALFMGGPADGWRIEVGDEFAVGIPINPHPPAFTTDSAVISAIAVPEFEYKREILTIGSESYQIYIPLDWDLTHLIENLIMSYKVDNERERHRYVRTAEGLLYDLDDRIPAGRPYKSERVDISGHEVARDGTVSVPYRSAESALRDY